MEGQQDPAQVEGYLKQFREFFNQYNKLSESCFRDCVNDFTTRKVLDSESKCALNCLEKHLKIVQRISERFQEHQLQQVDDQSAAMAGIAGQPK